LPGSRRFRSFEARNMGIDGAVLAGSDSAMVLNAVARGIEVCDKKMAPDQLMAVLHEVVEQTLVGGSGPSPTPARMIALRFAGCSREKMPPAGPGQAIMPHPPH